MRKTVFLVFCILLIFCFSGCGTFDRQKKTESSNAGKVLTQGEVNSFDFSVRSEIYRDISHQNSQITITYPVFLQEDMQEINADIVSFAADFAKEKYGADYVDLHLDLSYEIKRYDSAYLSIVFEGVGNVDTAAYPNNLFVTKNYDLRQKKEITLFNLCTVNTKFAEKAYAAFLQELSFTENAELVQMFQAGYPDADALLRTLFSCDGTVEDCQSYMTPQSIGISVPIVHAGGDHVEAEIAYE